MRAPQPPQMAVGRIGTTSGRSSSAASSRETWKLNGMSRSAPQTGQGPMTQPWCHVGRKLSHCRGAVVGQFELGGRGASRRALRAMGIARRTPSIAKKTRTNPTPSRTERTSVPGPDSSGPRSKGTKPPARIHHRRLITQGMPRSCHGPRRLPKARLRSQTVSSASVRVGRST